MLENIIISKINNAKKNNIQVTGISFPINTKWSELETILNTLKLNGNIKAFAIRINKYYTIRASVRL